MSLKAKIEAVIYASEEPVTLAQLMGLLGHEAQAELDGIASAQEPLYPEAETAASEPTDTPPVESGEPLEQAQNAKQEKDKARRLREYFRSLIDQLMADYANGDRGLEIREVAGGFRFSTKPEYHDAVRGFVKSLKPPLKLSLQALETLAVVAYKQPVTAPEISEIRGVDSGGVLGSLMARKLITTAGRKQVIGRPILYKTTKDFLLRFGLKDVNELPSIEEFEKMAGELAEQEEIPMQDSQEITAANLEEEKEATEPQADGDSSELETVPVDGRIPGLAPNYDQADDPLADSPARDAEIQGQQKGKEEP